MSRPPDLVTLSMRTIVEERIKGEFYWLVTWLLDIERRGVLSESWEKKRKDKEVKFLKYVEKELSHCVRPFLPVFQSCRSQRRIRFAPRLMRSRV
jgi:hypothetical protein